MCFCSLCSDILNIEESEYSNSLKNGAWAKVSWLDAGIWDPWIPDFRGNHSRYSGFEIFKQRNKCEHDSDSESLLTLWPPRTYMALKGHTYCTICDVISFSVRRYFWQLSTREEGNLAKHAQMRPIGWIELEFQANNLWTLRYKIKGKFALPTDGSLTIKISTFRDAWAKTLHRQERLLKGQQTDQKKKTDKKETKRTGLRIKKKKSRQVVFFSFKNCRNFNQCACTNSNSQILLQMARGFSFPSCGRCFDCSASIWLDNGHEMAFVPWKSVFLVEIWESKG